MGITIKFKNGEYKEINSLDIETHTDEAIYKYFNNDMIECIDVNIVNHTFNEIILLYLKENKDKQNIYKKIIKIAISKFNMKSPYSIIPIKDVNLSIRQCVKKEYIDPDMFIDLIDKRIQYAIRYINMIYMKETNYNKYIKIKNDLLNDIKKEMNTCYGNMIFNDK